MIVQLLTLAIQAANAAQLRGQASAGLNALSIATSVEGGVIALYGYVPSSLLADSGVDPSVRKPNDIAPASPGRWIIRDWPDTSATLGVHGELLIPIVIGNAPTPTGLLTANGWTVVGVTETGGITRAWIKRDVTVGS